MKPEQLREAVTDLLRDELQWQGEIPEGPLDRHLDSLQRMSLVVAIEDRFRICFEPEDEASIRDFADLLDCIGAKLAEAA